MCMCMCNRLCVMPPAPKLEDKIIKTKRQLLSGARLPAQGEPTADADVLDSRTFTLIATRPKKTREHTFVSPTRDFAPVTGVARRLCCSLISRTTREPVAVSLRADVVLDGFPCGRQHARLLSRSLVQQPRCHRRCQRDRRTNGRMVSCAANEAYYTDGNYGFNDYPRNAQKLAEDVIDPAAPHVDFSQYDNGTGSVEALVIIFSGSGGEVTGNVNDIWSHKWSITPKTVDGVTINRYFMAPEDGRVGVMAHELGHLLMDWPDLFDTDYSSAGTGRWDLMAGGSWNNNGNTPAHPSAWCKEKVGWVTPTTVFNASQSITLRPYATNADVVKLPIGDMNSKEYFLLSNRQKTAFDKHLPGEGCIIEHIDNNQTNNTNENHYLVDIEQSDGRSDLNKNANRGDASDPYPTASNANRRAMDRRSGVSRQRKLGRGDSEVRRSQSPRGSTGNATTLKSGQTDCTISDSR